MKVIQIKTKALFPIATLSKVLLLLFFFLTLGLSSFAQCNNPTVQIGSYHVEFVEVAYDFPNEGQSTWYYTITATAGKNISHVTFPLNKDCAEVLDAGIWNEQTGALLSGQGEPKIGKDPKAKIWGVKFNEKIYTGNEQNYYFTLEGNLAVAPVHEMAIKAGKPFYKGTICGPSPSCAENVEVPEASCVTGQAFHDANVNGIRETGELPIEGVLVYLLDDQGLVDQAFTDTDGTYSFCDLEVGSYNIYMENGDTEYFQTLPNVGDDQYDSDLLESIGMTEPYLINEIGDCIVNVDGGYFKFSDFDLQNFEEDNSNDNLVKTTDARRRRKTADPYPNTFEVPSVNHSLGINTQVFPNPVINEVTFKVNNLNEEEIVIELRNQSNTLIQKATITSFDREQRMNMSHLPNGIYYAVFSTKDTIEIKKIIKTN